jgi:hypothetical protein
MDFENHLRDNDSLALDEVKARLTEAGWVLQQSEDHLYFAVSHSQKLVTFRYDNPDRLLDALHAQEFDDPGTYEMLFGQPNN